MTKWVIKRPAPNCPLEVWEYITDVEEAKEYWYIAQAIDKYGIDTVVPLAMNRLGGYHHLPYDDPEIVCVVESEKKPKLKLFEKYLVNRPDFKYGWLSPDCTSYSCSYMGHINLANDICCELYNKDATGMVALYDEFLLDNGWIKVGRSGWYGRWEKISDQQVEFLESKNIKCLIDDEYIDVLRKEN